VNNGVVRLTRIVGSYTKMEARNTVKKVIGMKALVENIEVKCLNEWIKNNGIKIKSRIHDNFE
jgi:hypothetical protein